MAVLYDSIANSLILAASDDWETLLPGKSWTHLAATFNFDDGTMALYRNGEPLPATYTAAGDRWEVIGDPEPDATCKEGRLRNMANDPDFIRLS